MYFKPCWTRCGRFFYDSLNSLDFFLFVSVVRVDRLDRATNLPDFSLSSICDQLTRYFKGTRASFRTRNCRSFDILWLKNEIIKKSTPAVSRFGFPRFPQGCFPWEKCDLTDGARRVGCRFRNWKKNWEIATASTTDRRKIGEFSSFGGLLSPARAILSRWLARNHSWWWCVACYNGFEEFRPKNRREFVVNRELAAKQKVNSVCLPRRTCNLGMFVNNV